MRIAVHLRIGPRHSIFYPAPLTTGVVAPEKTARRRNVIAFFALGIIAENMHVQVRNSSARILPCLSSIAAASKPSMLQHGKNKVGIIRMDENIPNMRNLFSLERLGNRPLTSDFLGQVKKAIQGLPRGTSVLAAEQLHRTGPQINYALIMRVYGERPHVAIHYFLPGSTAILSAIATVEGNPCKNKFGSLPAPGQALDGAAGEKLPQRGHRSVAFLHHRQAVVK